MNLTVALCSMIEDAYNGGFNYLFGIIACIIGLVVLVVAVIIFMKIADNLDSIAGCAVLIGVVVLIVVSIIGGIGGCLGCGGSCDPGTEEITTTEIPNSNLGEGNGEASNNSTTSKETSTNSSTSQETVTKPVLSLSDDFGTDPKDYFGVYYMCVDYDVVQIEFDADGVDMLFVEEDSVSKTSANYKYLNKYYVMAKFGVSSEMIVIYDDDINENSIFFLRKNSNGGYYLEDYETNTVIEKAPITTEFLSTYKCEAYGSYLTLIEGFTATYEGDEESFDFMYFYADGDWIEEVYGVTYGNSIVLCEEGLNSVYILKIVNSSKLMLAGEDEFVKYP